MSQLIWNCHFESSDAANNMTVGQALPVICRGDNSAVHVDNLEFRDIRMKEETPSLSLLKLEERNQDQAQLFVTSYRVGSHKSEEVFLWDGVNKIGIQGLDWTVKSVLKEDQQEPQQPYPAFPMISLKYPIWFWGLLGLIIIVLVVSPLLQVLKVRKRKRQFEELKKLETALNPLDSFYKEMRKLDRHLEMKTLGTEKVTKRLQEEFYAFLSRKLQLPIFLWKEKQILKEIKARHPKIFRDCGLDIKKILRELEKASQNQDLKVYTHLQKDSQKVAEEIFDAYEKYYGRKR